MHTLKTVLLCLLLAAARAYRNDEDSRLQRAYEAKKNQQP